MRCALILLLTTMLQLPAAAQENDGEKFFREIEKKIKAADAIQAASSISIQVQGKEVVFKGSLLLTKDNKARLLLNGNEGGLPFNVEMVSDGKLVRMNIPFLATKDLMVPKQFHDTMSDAVCRIGLLTGMIFEKGDTDFENIDKFIQLSEFKLEAAEKVGNSDTKVVSYLVNVIDKNDPARITLWVDAKTLAPVKRLIVPTKQAAGETLTETYQQFTFNPKIDFNFALPPKKTEVDFKDVIPPDQIELPNKVQIDPALEATVSGKVTYKGKPITGAYIDFYPAVGDLRGEESDAAGQYAVKGLQEGECIVVVNSSRVPAALRDRYTTTLKVTLKKGANVFDIQLD
jgi:outer membrane lipoprotein-sorting protein